MLVLDIGAGDKTFGRKLKRLNPQIKTVLCGEPRWKYKYEPERAYSLPEKIAFYIANIQSDLRKVLNESEIQEVLNGTRNGVHRITSRYNNIALPDDSVDMVTLNSPHPMMYPGVAFFNGELCRVLKVGGMFYFGHSTHISTPAEGEFSSSFELAGGGRFDFRKGILQGVANGFAFPISPTIHSNAKVLFWRELNQKHGYSPDSYSGYLYNPSQIPLVPNWKVWIKK